MAQVLKRVDESTGETGSLIGPHTLAPVAWVEKQLATDYSQNEPSYTLHRNHWVHRSHYQKTKAYFPLHALQVDLLTPDEIQRRHNNPYKLILLVISVFSRYAYAVLLCSKIGDEVSSTLESAFKQDSNGSGKWIFSTCKKVLTEI